MNDVKNIDIHPVLREWLKAVEQRDADLISSLYAESAVLIPLMSNTIRNGNELIRDYFEQFFTCGGSACTVLQFWYDAEERARNMFRKLHVQLAGRGRTGTYQGQVLLCNR